MITKFEMVGINYQYDAKTKEEANKSFEHSCKCCCNRGMHIDCDHCAIERTHALVVAYFDDKEKARG